MPKGQQRGNKEAKKPKKKAGAPPPVAPGFVAPTVATAVNERAKRR